MRGSHKNLIAWKESISLVKEIYLLTSNFPNSEIYGLTSQIRRASISVASNIAEGAARVSKKEFVHFLSLARGSLSELETQVDISEQLNLMKAAHDLKIKINLIFALINGLIKKHKLEKQT